MWVNMEYCSFVPSGVGGVDAVRTSPEWRIEFFWWPSPLTKRYPESHGLFGLCQWFKSLQLSQSVSAKYRRFVQMIKSTAMSFGTRFGMSKVSWSVTGTWFGLR